MAFSAGIHVACASIGDRADASLVAIVAWSETLIAAGTTTNAVPSMPTSVFEIAAAVDAWVAVGKSPDAVGGPRLLVRAGETRNVFCNPGDKLAWVAA